ncbi:YetF domain-containing protein [Robertmurraya sp. FSL R5-0851]|uniref:YetF domain-containing protein n=2 Tax=Robertmurraya sp. FSL R5-0851 TaxID=2921584 RepID=UPI0030FCCED2
MKIYKYPPPFRGIPRNFIIDGKLVMDHLKGTGKDENWVSNMLQANGIQSLSDIAVAQLDELGTVFLDKKTKDTL